MTVYNYLSPNVYPGRGIIAGLSPDSEWGVCAYFIMGRSENSRNRVFVENGEDVTIYPYDSTKVEDPSLIIYSPVRTIENKIIATNGDQTDTVYDFIKNGKTFEDALETRVFEPDAHNYTPRISALLNFDNGNFDYKLNIIKRVDTMGVHCCHFTYKYSPVSGHGHIIHTYLSNGNPLPSFAGDPMCISVLNDIDDYTTEIWRSLDETNKVSLTVIYKNIKTGEIIRRIINKNNGEIR